MRAAKVLAYALISTVVFLSAIQASPIQPHRGSDRAYRLRIKPCKPDGSNCQLRGEGGGGIGKRQVAASLYDRRLAQEDEISEADITARDEAVVNVKRGNLQAEKSDKPPGKSNGGKGGKEGDGSNGGKDDPPKCEGTNCDLKLVKREQHGRRDLSGVELDSPEAKVNLKPPTSYCDGKGDPRCSGPAKRESEGESHYGNFNKRRDMQEDQGVQNNMKPREKRTHSAVNEMTKHPLGQEIGGGEGPNNPNHCPIACDNYNGGKICVPICPKKQKKVPKRDFNVEEKDLTSRGNAEEAALDELSLPRQIKDEAPCPASCYPPKNQNKVLKRVISISEKDGVISRDDAERLDQLFLGSKRGDTPCSSRCYPPKHREEAFDQRDREHEEANSNDVLQRRDGAEDESKPLPPCLSRCLKRGENRRGCPARCHPPKHRGEVLKKRQEVAAGGKGRIRTGNGANRCTGPKCGGDNGSGRAEKGCRHPPCHRNNVKRGQDTESGNDDISERREMQDDEFAQDDFTSTAGNLLQRREHNKGAQLCDFPCDQKDNITNHNCPVGCPGHIDRAEVTKRDSTLQGQEELLAREQDDAGASTDLLHRRDLQNGHTIDLNGKAKGDDPGGRRPACCGSLHGCKDYHCKREEKDNVMKTRTIKESRTGRTACAYKDPSKCSGEGGGPPR